MSKAPANPRRHRGSDLPLHRETQVCYCYLVTISTDNSIETNESAPALAPTGRFSRIWAESQKGLDIAGYTDPQHNPLIGSTAAWQCATLCEYATA